MRALILAAGYGTRLHPLTLSTAKCMIDIAGKPCLERIVDHLAGFGITEVIVNVHWLKEQIMNHFGNMLLYYYEPELLGAEETEKRLKNWLGDRYLVANGDTLTDLNIENLINDSNYNYCTVESWDEVYTGTKIVVSGTEPKKMGYSCYWQDIGTPGGLAKARKHYEE